MLIKILEVFIPAFLMIILSTYIWHTIDMKTDKLMSKKMLISFIICLIFVTTNRLFNDDFIKPFVSTIIMMLYYHSLYKSEIKRAIILPLYTQLLILLSKIGFTIVVIMLFNSNNELIFNSFFGKIISSIFIFIICILVSKIPIVAKIYNEIKNGTNRIKDKHLIVVSIFLIILLNILTILVHNRISLTSLLIVNTIIIVIYALFIYVYLKTNNNYLKIYDKYTTTYNSLKEYEDILSRYRVLNHERKNQLLTIRGMAINKKVKSYIDEIIDDKVVDDDNLMINSLIIPEGGLRGLIYSKMLLMKEKNIECELCIDNILKSSDLSSISDDLMVNICNILGVYIDNAIDEVEKLVKKYIIIEIYYDETLNIAITNNYIGKIDIDKIDNVGYSTKGGNHGYGLSLVKEIIDNNSNISNIRRINDEEFTQEIRIKL